MDHRPAAGHAGRRGRTAPGGSSAGASRRGLVFPAQLAADGRLLPCSVRRAESFAERGRGLLWHAPLEPGQALWILRCGSIHTVGMRYAIDVVFLNADHRVLRVAHDVGPLRFRMCRGAVSVVELLSGQAAALDLVEGQRLTALAPANESAAAARPPSQERTAV